MVLPYPRVAPTYRQENDSEMIKLDLLLFLPLERSVRYLLSNCKDKKDITNPSFVYKLLFTALHFIRILQWWGKTAKGPIFLALATE
jgi:hypothetical protein